MSFACPQFKKICWFASRRNLFALFVPTKRKAFPSFVLPLAVSLPRIVEYKVGQSENVNKKKLEGYGLLPMVSKTAKIFVGQITFYS